MSGPNLPPDHTLFAAKPSHFVDLQSGAPSADLLPSALVGKACQLACSDDYSWAGQYEAELNAQQFLQYGPTYGDSTVRESLAAFLNRHYCSTPEVDVPVTTDRLIISSGASAGFASALLAFALPASRGGPTLRVFLPKATYFLCFGALRDAGFRLPIDGWGESADVEGLPEDSQGIIVEELERRLQHIDTESPPPRSPKDSDGLQVYFRYVVYLVPTHSNPTGTTISADRRRRLIEIAAIHHVLIICDDVYELLGYSARGDIPRLSAFDVVYGTGNNVVSNCSFSKILCPGARLGYFEGGPKLLDAIATTGSWSSGGGPAHLTSRLILPLALGSALPFLQTPRTKSYFLVASEGPTALDYYLAFIRRAYSCRLSTLMSAIKADLLPLGFSLPFGEPKGGFFVLLQLPGDIAFAAFKEACLIEEVMVGWGPAFLVDSRADDGMNETVRLCWAYNQEERLVEGVRRLAAATGRAHPDMLSDSA